MHEYLAHVNQAQDKNTKQTAEQVSTCQIHHNTSEGVSLTFGTGKTGASVVTPNLSPADAMIPSFCFTFRISLYAHYSCACLSNMAIHHSFIIPSVRHCALENMISNNDVSILAWRDCVGIENIITKWRPILGKYM